MIEYASMEDLKRGVGDRPVTLEEALEEESQGRRLDDPPKPTFPKGRIISEWGTVIDANHVLRAFAPRPQDVRTGTIGGPTTSVAISW